MSQAAKGLRWRQVVAAYGEVLAEELRFGRLISEKKLLNSKEEIKKALIEALNEAGPYNTPLKGHLEFAFLGLQQFVDPGKLQEHDQGLLLEQAETLHPGIKNFREIHDRLTVLTGEYLQSLRLK